jgi:6-phosphogluconolactonase
VADLGLDSVLAYAFDEERGTLTPQPQATLALAPGSGPRHLAFGANGRFVYVIDELSSALTVFGYADGARKEIQTVSTLPAEFRGASTTAEVVVTPDGRFLYGSNRGHDSIAIFAIDSASGRLTLVGHQPTLGKTPRNFAIDPTGAFLIAANQNSDTLVVFRVDHATGRLTPVGEPVSVPRPVCVLMKRTD